MTRSSVSTSKRDGNRPAENSYQSSRSGYLRAFASARAMRFWRPRLAVKELTVAAVFAAALAMGPSAAQAQFPASFDLSTLDGTNGFVINGVNPSDFSGGSVSSAGDVNGDGFEDVLCTGNIYNTEVETPRLDAGSGLVLMSDGENLQIGKCPQECFYISGNVKKMILLKANEKTLVISGVNNAPLNVLEL